MAERLVFGSSVESMVRALGVPLSPGYIKKLQSIGIDMTKPLLAGYPQDVYVKLVDLVGEAKYPMLPPEQRDYELGRDFIKNFGTTMMGKAVLAMTRVMGPRRATHRLTRAMRSVNNYTDSQATDVGPTTIELWCAPVNRPHYYRGVLEEAGKSMHSDSYKCELLGFQNERADFRISWNE